MKRLLFFAALLVAVVPAWSAAQEFEAFRSRVLAATTGHLNLLLREDGSVVELKGKAADGETALAFYRTFEVTGDQRFRTAAIVLADRILQDMRATKHGVLFIKEKDKGGEKIEGGGPPAFGWYVSAAAYILHHEGGRADDLRYLATVADNFPWNENGWWANTMDIHTGVPKEPITKAGAINKNAGMALAAGMLSACVREIDPALAARLQAKAEKCVYGQIIPKQETDGYWSYGLKGNDPKDKDVLGYFMVTVDALAKLRHYAPALRQPALDAALERAFAFARSDIMPMTDPNTGPPSKRRTSGTPQHFTRGKETKRGFTLGAILVAGGNQREAMTVIDHWAQNFPTGDRGQDGAKAVDAFAHMLLLLPSSAKP